MIPLMPVNYKEEVESVSKFEHYDHAKDVNDEQHCLYFRRA